MRNRPAAPLARRFIYPNKRRDSQRVSAQKCTPGTHSESSLFVSIGQRFAQILRRFGIALAVIKAVRVAATAVAVNLNTIATTRAGERLTFTFQQPADPFAAGVAAHTEITDAAEIAFKRQLGNKIFRTN